MHCRKCDLVFVKPDERLPPVEEKKRYDNHENNPHDDQYRSFLHQLFDPLHIRLKPGSSGLDYGSGPGPTLSLMFEEAGYSMSIFDPFYANEVNVFDKNYDFITTTETVEHFYNPGNEFEKLWNILKPGGFFGIMTLLRPEDQSFADWHYIRDETHVSLYSKKTFRWLADFLNSDIEFISKRVIIFKKNKTSEHL